MLEGSERAYNLAGVSVMVGADMSEEEKIRQGAMIASQLPLDRPDALAVLQIARSIILMDAADHAEIGSVIRLVAGFAEKDLD